MPKDRLYFETIEPGVTGDNLQAVKDGDGITITVDNPWAGSTETGFGYASTVRLSHDQAREFAEWLLDSLK